MANRQQKGRHTADLDGDFVVFLIGARFHRLWKLTQWLPVMKSMIAMQREIALHPEIGCLRIENYGTTRPIAVQYWRSFRHLEEFARSDRWSHLEAWRRFNKLVRDSGDVGIWHETYRVRAGEFEAMYGNMPVVGLAAAGESFRLDADSTAASRLGERSDDRAPLPGY